MALFLFKVLDRNEKEEKPYANFRGLPLDCSCGLSHLYSAFII
jgi:hypothetical protein